MQKPSLGKNFFVLTISFCRLDSFQYYPTLLDRRWKNENWRKSYSYLVLAILNYSCVHISLNEVFFKILKKPFIVQKKMIPHMKVKLIFIGKTASFPNVVSTYMYRLYTVLHIFDLNLVMISSLHWP